MQDLMKGIGGNPFYIHPGAELKPGMGRLFGLMEAMQPATPRPTEDQPMGGRMAREGIDRAGQVGQGAQPMRRGVWKELAKIIMEGGV